MVVADSDWSAQRTVQPPPRAQRAADGCNRKLGMQTVNDLIQLMSGVGQYGVDR